MSAGSSPAPFPARMRALAAGVPASGRSARRSARRDTAVAEDAGRGVAIVIGAERISGPFPELCFCLHRRSADQRKNGSWPHVCKLLLTSSGPPLGRPGHASSTEVVVAERSTVCQASRCQGSIGPKPRCGLTLRSRRPVSRPTPDRHDTGSSCTSSGCERKPRRGGSGSSRSRRQDRFRPPPCQSRSESSRPDHSPG